MKINQNEIKTYTMKTDWKETHWHEDRLKWKKIEIRKKNTMKWKFYFYILYNNLLFKLTSHQQVGVRAATAQVERGAQEVECRGVLRAHGVHQA